MMFRYLRVHLMSFSTAASSPMQSALPVFNLLDRVRLMEFVYLINAVLMRLSVEVCGIFQQTRVFSLNVNKSFGQKMIAIVFNKRRFL